MFTPDNVNDNNDDELFRNPEKEEEEMLANYFHSDGEDDINNQCEERIEAIIAKCEEELGRLRLLLWAAAKTHGGKLLIKDKYIAQGGPGIRWVRKDDNKNKQIILTARGGE